MKFKVFSRICFFILLPLSTLSVYAQSASVKENALNIPSLKVAAKVDERFELLSIIVRLAGYEEYVSNIFKSYADDVDKHFAAYKEHPAVKMAVRLRKSNSIGYDAVASMAVHLTPALTPKVPFSDNIPDKRWGKENALEFAKLLQQFYKDAKCASFFQSHAALYKEAESRFQQLLNKVDLGWYQRFYGEMPKGSFNVYVGLLDGPNNFGPKVVYPDSTEEMFAVIGTWQVDEKGMPVYDDKSLPLIIHEFNHCFINHLVYAVQGDFQPSGEKIFPLIAEKMKRNAYANWITVINESLVRSAVIRYLFDHNEPAKAYSTIMNERISGFLWMDELFVLLGVYENNRKAYPTFRSYISFIQGYYNDLVSRIEERVRVLDEQTPKITAIDPFENNSQEVDPKITQITFSFDRPLLGKGYSINWGKGGKDHFGITKVTGYNTDNTKVTVEVALKPDWEYEFVLTGLSFKSKEGYPIQNYSVKFKTRP